MGQLERAYYDLAKYSPWPPNLGILEERYRPHHDLGMGSACSSAGSTLGVKPSFADRSTRPGDQLVSKEPGSSWFAPGRLWGSSYRKPR